MESVQYNKIYIMKKNVTPYLLAIIIKVLKTNEINQILISFIEINLLFIFKNK